MENKKCDEKEISSEDKPIQRIGESIVRYTCKENDNELKLIFVDTNPDEIQISDCLGNS